VNTTGHGNKKYKEKRRRTSARGDVRTPSKQVGHVHKKDSGEGLEDGKMKPFREYKLWIYGGAEWWPGKRSRKLRDKGRERGTVVPIAG